MADRRSTGAQLQRRLWQRPDAMLHCAELRRQQAQLDLVLTQRQLTSNLRTSYLDAKSALAQLDLMKRSLDLVTESLRLTDLRYEAGESTVLEVVDAQNTLAQARNAYDDGLSRYRLALAIAEPNTGDFLIKLKKDRKRSLDEVTDELRAKITTSEPAIEVESPHILEDLVGDLAWSPEPIEIKVFHDNEATYKEVAKRIEEWLPKVHGVVDVVNQTFVIGPAANFRVDLEKAQRAGCCRWLLVLGPEQKCFSRSQSR
jgi:hypothetical protein